MLMVAWLPAAAHIQALLLMAVIAVRGLAVALSACISVMGESYFHDQTPPGASKSRAAEARTTSTSSDEALPSRAPAVAPNVLCATAKSEARAATMMSDPALLYKIACRFVSALLLLSIPSCQPASIAIILYIAVAITVLALWLAPAGRPQRSLIYICATAAATACLAFRPPTLMHGANFGRCSAAAAAAAAGRGCGITACMEANKTLSATAEAVPAELLTQAASGRLALAPGGDPVVACLIQLGASLALSLPQLLRPQFHKLLGWKVASDLRRGGGPVVQFLALSSMLTVVIWQPCDHGCQKDLQAPGDTRLLQCCVVAYAVLTTAGLAAAPTKNWSVARQHGQLMMVAALAMVASIAAAVQRLLMGQESSC